MAKNKGKHGKGKSQVEETDEFVSGVNKFFDKLKPYARRIGVMLGVVVVGFLAFVIYDWYRDRGEQKGTTLYVQASDVLRHRVEVKDDNPLPDEPPKPDEAAPGDLPRPTYETTAEQAENALVKLKELESEAGGSDAAAHGTLLRARALLDLGKHDEAEKLFKSYASDAPSALLRTIAREGVGYTLEARAMASADAATREAGLKAALEAFRKMQPDDKGPRRLDARYHEARLLATLGDKAKAGEIYKEILDSEPPAGLEEQVSGRLALLDVAPPAPPPAPTGDDKTDDNGDDGDDEGGDEGGEAPEPAGDDAP